MNRTTEPRAALGTIDMQTTFERGAFAIVRGWVADADAPDSRTGDVTFVIDGDRVDAVVGSDAVGGGFVAVFSTSRMPIGPHTLRVFGPSEASSAYALPPFAFTIVPQTRFAHDESIGDGRFLGRIDDWAQARSGPETWHVYARGWVYDLEANVPVETVFSPLAIEGHAHAIARFPRPDVAALFDDERMTDCGFRIRFALRDRDARSRELRVATGDRRAIGRLEVDATARVAVGETLRPARASLESDILADVLDLDRIRRDASSGVRFDQEHDIDTQSPVYAFPVDLANVDVSALRHYEATPTATIEAALDAVPFDVRDATFIDFGCGKGRALIRAARRPFAAVVGVEIHPDLVAVARANLERIDPADMRAGSVTVVEANVAEYELPPGNVVAFLYNPFDETILEPLADRLANAACERVAVIYVNPVHRQAIEGTSSFDAVATFPEGRLYLRRSHAPEVVIPPAFACDAYRDANPDLAHLTDDELADHYTAFGEREGRRAHRIVSREAFAALVPRDAAALEIGPYFRPLLRGGGAKYFDVMPSDALRARAAADGTDGAAIPDIDFVSTTGDLGVVDERFDFVLSSHAIEHQPDLISHLRGVERLLRPGGRYFLLVPDKRYCFDHFSPESSFAEIVEAYHERRTRHTLRSILGQSVMTTHNDCTRHWNGDHGTFLEDAGARTQAGIEEFESAGDAYLDVHAWYFTPTSARLVFEALADAEYTGLRIEQIYPTLRDRDEFWLVIRKTTSRTDHVRADLKSNDHASE